LAWQWLLVALYVAYQDSIKEFFLFYIWDYFDARFFSNPNNYYIQKKGSGLFFRGQIIWEAIMNELLSIGMSKAKQVKLLPQSDIVFFPDIFITTSNNNAFYN
jgi:hypothetical protein